MTKIQVFQATLISLLFINFSGAANQAHFEIVNEVVQPSIEPFSATIPEFGNGIKLSGSGGFEPNIFRTMFLTNDAAKNTIYLQPKNLTAYDSWKEGAFENAEVEVLRIRNGKFVSIRRSKVAKRGHSASGWTPQFGSRLIPRGINEIDINIPKWSKQDTHYYYSIRSVDSDNRLSKHSNYLKLKPPVDKGNDNQKLKLDNLRIKDGITTISPPTYLHVANQTPNKLTISWQPIENAKGYILYRSDISPEHHKGYSLKLKDIGPSIKTGDLIILRHKYYSTDRNKLLTKRVWSAHQAEKPFRQPLLSNFSNDEGKTKWKLIKHANGTNVLHGGETYLSAKITHQHDFSIGRYTHSGTAQQWYDVLDPKKTYNLSVWLKGSGSIKVKARLPEKDIVLNIEPTWKQYNLTFSVPEIYTDTLPRRIDLLVSGNGNVSVDNFKLYETDSEYLAFPPEDIQALQESGMSHLRTHGFIKTFQNTYDLEQLTNPAGVITTAKGNTLPQTLDALKSVKINPWIQLEPHLTANEWLGFLEYLASPFNPNEDSIESKPWAAKRYYSGQEKPYSDDFDKIRFEIGNETWNQLFSPWTFSPMTDGVTNKRYSAAKVYGMYQHYVLEILKSSPYWNRVKDKFEPVIGGWSINSYGEDAAAMSPDTKLVTVAEYVGGWDQDEGVVTDTPDGYNSLLSFAAQTATERAASHISRAKSDFKVGTYEAGPGYVMNGLNNAKVTHEQYLEQEIVMKSVASGTATLDTFLTQLRAGYTVQNFFLFKRGDYWSSHAKWYRGGHSYPSWLWLSLLNNMNENLGDLLKVKSEGIPRKDLPAMARRKEKGNAPMIDIFPFYKNNQLTVFALSREVTFNSTKADNTSNIVIQLPEGMWKLKGVWNMTGEYNASNALSAEAKLKYRYVQNSEYSQMLSLKELTGGKALVYILQKE
ncbi:hypothetical protein NQT74_01900 [Alteromonas stellipolaris]|uniref:hypothetical protein n=1 Tax=Alteromonas stellipolaris TaxID=233316 RepID=UPI002117DE5A|nr:hypothetical protein [Alteromonas stellipolaris]MCQ8847329.1 hypothetical protein [Alteromonas stellipolaris]